MGYIAHLMRLAQLLAKMSETNENLQAILKRRSGDGWVAFEQTVLKQRMALRSGSLCKSNANSNPKQKQSRFMGMFQEFSRNRAKHMQVNNDDNGIMRRKRSEELEEDEEDALMSGRLFQRADDYGGGFQDQRTKQSEMDSLMQMSLEYTNNDDENDTNQDVSEN